MSGFGAARAAAFDAAGRAQQRQLFLGMSAFERHQKMVHDLATYYGVAPAQSGPGAPAQTDWDILRDNFRFIRSEADDAADSWEVRLAKRYYSKLFKEYAIADLSRYREGKVGLRWRTQREVVSGRGQFVCGAKGCDERRGLASFEVPFAYQEAGERKQALVKVRLCPTHAYHLNYRKHKKAERAAKQAARDRRKARRRKERRKERKKRRRGGSGKEGQGRGKDSKRGRRKCSRSSDSSEPTSSSISGSSSNDASSSSSSESEGGQQRSGRKRRRGEPAAGEPGATVPLAAAGAAPPAAAAAGAAAGAAPFEDDFEAFLRGLFE